MPNSPTPPTKYTLLLVDDTPMNLGVLSEYLENAGFKIVAARDGESGLKRAQYARPDVILLDVMMPGMDGFETCRRLKADPATRDIPVIFMTALAGVEDKVKGFATGAVDYVTKPLQQEEVLARVSTHLKIRDLTRSLQKRTQQLEASQLIAERIASLLNLTELLAAVAELIQVRFGYYFVGIWLANDDQTQLQLQAESCFDATLALGQGYALPVAADYLATQAYRSGQLALSHQVKSDPRLQPLRPLAATQAEMCLLLKFAGDNLGVLDLHSEDPQAFGADEHAALQTMANQIAIALRNARLYQLAEQRARELAELNTSKDRFFSIVAHDLKSPFNPLLGLSQLQARAPDDTPMADVRFIASRINASARSAYNLLENLLQWSRVQLGRMEHEPEPLGAQELAAINLRLLNEIAAEKNIQLENAVPDDLRIYADRNIISTILRNLISNALKFTPADGRVTVRAQPSPSAPDHWVEISVQDTGVGIRPEDLSKLFKLGKTHTTLGTAQEQGTGLGLLLCQDLTAQNGGSLRIESQVGQGTTVTFTTPRAAPAPASN
jgi:signal transduction histidine kinase